MHIADKVLNALATIHNITPAMMKFIDNMPGSLRELTYCEAPVPKSDAEDQLRLIGYVQEFLRPPCTWKVRERGERGREEYG